MVPTYFAHRPIPVKGAIRPATLTNAGIISQVMRGRHALQSTPPFASEMATAYDVATWILCIWRPMRFRHFSLPVSLDPADDFRLIDDCLHEAEMVEELCWDSIWLSEHHFGGETAYADPLVFGAAVAAKTKRVQLRFSVVELELHNPVRLEIQTALVDNISRGRLTVGLGRHSRYNVFEYKGFGTSMKVVLRFHPSDVPQPSPVGFAMDDSLPYEERQKVPGDYEAQTSQRRIAVHALERLGDTDRGIIMLRRPMRRNVRALANGETPQICQVPDGDVIRTYASNTVVKVAPGATPKVERVLRETGRKVSQDMLDGILPRSGQLR